MLSEIVSWVNSVLWYTLEDYQEQHLYISVEKPNTVNKKYVLPQNDDIRLAINDFLASCGIPFQSTPYDQAFHNMCCDEARKRGYPMNDLPGMRSLSSFIPGGVVMATTAYTHLDDQPTRIFIALYTAFLIYLDDIFQYNIESVSGFNNRFICCQPQEDPVLDAFASLLREFPRHFGPVASNIMVTSTLNLVTALLLEYETQDMILSSSAHGYPTFSRVLSGASETYALFAFPRTIPLQGYIQTLPELMMFINNGNDILSFYKEELAGESVNRISNLARCHAVSKIEVLRRLSEDATACHRQILQILEPHDEAWEAYVNFCRGYFGFHASLARYKLRELLVD